jgi:cytochrome c-type biogenesis protein CcmH
MIVAARKANSFRSLAILGVLALVAVSALLLGRGEQDNSPQARTDRIAADIKCPTCQGLSVLQSKVGGAKLIYDEIARRVAEGQSDTQVRSFLVNRYGQQQLLRPEATGVAAIAWIAPVVVMILAFFGLWIAMRRNRYRTVRALTIDDELLVNSARTSSTRASSQAGN